MHERPANLNVLESDVDATRRLGHQLWEPAQSGLDAVLGPDAEDSA